MVHEDLLCLSSPHFREKLQPKRKALDEAEEPECHICKEPLEPGVKDLTYCKESCGTSFHHDCIMEWKLARNGAASEKCPMCRANWPIDTQWMRHYVRSDLDPVGYSIYQEWLYRGHISVEDIEQTDHPNYIILLKAYFFGRRVEDNKFAVAVLKAFQETFKETGDCPSVSTIKYAYDNSDPESPLRSLLVRMYTDVADPKALWGETFGENPTPFLVDIVRALRASVATLEKKVELEEAKANLCGNGNEHEDVDLDVLDALDW